MSSTQPGMHPVWQEAQQGMISTYGTRGAKGNRQSFSQAALNSDTITSATSSSLNCHRATAMHQGCGSEHTGPSVPPAGFRAQVCSSCMMPFQDRGLGSLLRVSCILVLGSAGHTSWCLVSSASLTRLGPTLVASTKDSAYGPPPPEHTGTQPFKEQGSLGAASLTGERPLQGLLSKLRVTATGEVPYDKKNICLV